MSEGTPAMWMRGGTSKGLYFLKEDIPNDIAKREDFLLSVFGSPDNLQINGVGGGNPLTSKVAIVSKSKRSNFLKKKLIVKKIILLNIFYFSFCTVVVKSAEKGGMPQLDPEFWVSQIFWLTITFGTLFLVLSKFILPRISKNLEQRRLQILENIETAEKQREQSEKNLKEFDEIILKSKNKAKEVMLAAREKVVSEITKKKMKLDEDLNSEIQNVEKEIIELKLSSPKNINSIASNITNEVIKKLIGTDVNESSVSALVEEELKKLDEKEKLNEIARMLSGKEITEEAINAARKLITYS